MRTTILLALAVLLLGVSRRGQNQTPETDARPFTDSFTVLEDDLSPTGRNPFFILEPGYALALEDASGRTRLTVTVLGETKQIGNVLTRVVEERETLDGQVTEVSRNYLAICKTTNSVYYFGEDAGGAWLHGQAGARFGLMMPGTVLVGARYFEEIAPGVGMDRAEIVSLNETVETAARKFVKALKIKETTPLELGVTEDKFYAAGIGLIQDGELRLVKYGKQ